MKNSLQPFVLLLLIFSFFMCLTSLQAETKPDIENTKVLSEVVEPMAFGDPRVLSDPFLQNPSRDGVYVAWVTSFAGVSHSVFVEDKPVSKTSSLQQEQYENNTNTFTATSDKLERLFEDQDSKLENAPSKVMQRQAYRHEAYISGLETGARYRYWVKSTAQNGKVFSVGPFTLQSLPTKKQPLQILLTSDQQERFNSLVNYQMVAELFPSLDAIFFAGDLVNHPRRASEWFDNFQTDWLDNPLNARPSFFPAMQGNFKEFVPSSPFSGGELLQNVPMFPSVANHEVSGRFRPNQSVIINNKDAAANINFMFSDAQPRWYALAQYQQLADEINPKDTPSIKEQWLRDNSHDFESYRDLFNVPDNGPEGEAYYSKQVGDVFLISMNVSRIWRNWSLNSKSKFSENPSELNNPIEWGFGEHLFTPFGKGTTQYQWLQGVIKSKAFKQSRYKVVMFHQSASGLGDNAVPILTDPIMTIDHRNKNGEIITRTIAMPQSDKARAEIWHKQVQPLLGSIVDVRYEYPIAQDFFHRDIEPMLQRAGVQLVLHGHSHIWNRTKVGKMHYLETSAASNCFGAVWSKPDGSVWNNKTRGSGVFNEAVAAGKFKAENYPPADDPHGREPIMPSIANPMVEFGVSKEPVPFVCDNGISTFSVLDTVMGAVRSFAIDVKSPNTRILEFDRFNLDE